MQCDEPHTQTRQATQQLLHSRCVDDRPAGAAGNRSVVVHVGCDCGACRTTARQPRRPHHALHGTVYEHTSISSRQPCMPDTHASSPFPDAQWLSFVTIGLSWKAPMAGAAPHTAHRSSVKSHAAGGAAHWRQRRARQSRRACVWVTVAAVAVVHGGGGSGRGAGGASWRRHTAQRCEPPRVESATRHTPAQPHVAHENAHKPRPQVQATTGSVPKSATWLAPAAHF
jgi:hypothetical protein